MKKLVEEMKKKGVYVVSLCGVVAILAVAAIAMSLTGNSVQEQPKVDLNETPNISSKEQDLVQSKPEIMEDLQTEEKQTADNQIKEESNLAQEETNIVQQQEESFIISNELLLQQEAENVQGSEQEIIEESAEVSSINSQNIISNLVFVPEQGLAWPIVGEVILNYSPEHAVYHVTLDSYRTTDAIWISGTEGMPVCAAVKGVVTDITEELKTGLTVTMRISEEYSIRYGQLGTVTVKVGDVVEQGKQFATLGKPTKYYVKEGPSLYLQVLQGEKSINPMLYLQDAE